MTSPTLCLAVLAASKEAFDAFPLTLARKECDELTLIVTTDGRFGGFGAIANRIRQASRCDVVGLMHADIMFLPGALSSFARAAADGKVVGMVGRQLGGAYTWSRDVAEDTPVSTLDGSSVFFPRHASDRIQFDQDTFDSFHCGVEDFCLSARSVGMPVVVPHTPWIDHMSGYTKSYLNPEWQAAYWRYREKLVAKWSHIQFTTT
jgi:GT2 family glycosyltransferase